MQELNVSNKLKLKNLLLKHLLKSRPEAVDDLLIETSADACHLEIIKIGLTTEFESGMIKAVRERSRFVDTVSSLGEYYKSTSIVTLEVNGELLHVISSIHYAIDNFENEFKLEYQVLDLKDMADYIEQSNKIADEMDEIEKAFVLNNGIYHF